MEIEFYTNFIYKISTILTRKNKHIAHTHTKQRDIVKTLRLSVSHTKCAPLPLNHIVGKLLEYTHNNITIIKLLYKLALLDF